MEPIEKDQKKMKICVRHEDCGGSQAPRTGGLTAAEKSLPKRTLPPPQGEQAPVREPRLGRVHTHLAKRRTEGGGERPRLGRLDLDLQCRQTA
jgi:hypothetical protein